MAYGTVILLIFLERVFSVQNEDLISKICGIDGKFRKLL